MPRDSWSLVHWHMPGIVSRGLVGVVNLLTPSAEVTAQSIHDKVQGLSQTKYIVVRAASSIVKRVLQENNPWQEHARVLGLRLPTAFGCLVHFLVRVNVDILGVHVDALSRLHDPSTFSIGIHLELAADSMGSSPDAERDSEQGLAAMPKLEVVARQQALLATKSLLLECAQRVEDYWASTSTNVTWFISTPSLTAKAAASYQYKDKVLLLEEVNANSPEQREQASYAADRLAAAEWELFSRCDYFIFEEFSSVQTAAVVAHKPHNIYIYRRAANGSSPLLAEWCTPWKPSAIADSAL
eukprot:SM000127S26633  [mRNA]  locus=s127:149802:151353:- [translate_table: standard]